MKRVLVVVAFAVTMLLASSTHDAQTAPAAGQIDARSRAAAEKLMALIGGDENRQRSHEEMMRNIDRMTDAQPGSEEARKKVKETMNSMMNAMAKEFSGKMDAIFIDAYAQTFTADELNAIVAFYETPIGKKFIEKQPQVTSAAMLKMNEIILAIMPDLMRKAR